MTAGAPAPTRHESELGYWEMIPRTPPAAIAPFVRRIDGYVQRLPSSRHRQLPSGILPFIISIGEPLHGAPAHAEERLEPYQGFVAGLHDSYATTAFEGTMSGVQIDLSPLGMHMLLGGVPMHELTNRMVHLDEVLGRDGRELVEQVQDEPTWEGRFARMEGFIAERLRRAAHPPAEDAAYAWQRLNDTAGCIAIGSLAEEMGYSRRQLLDCFREYVGLTPKLAARVLRFRHALEIVSADPTSSWTDIAFDAGYYDQSHLIRDFVEFAGCTPTDYVSRLLPDGGGLRGD